MADPWMKFYPTDWRSDAALRLCSRAARGTWIDMLSIMHEAEPRGDLRVGQVALTPATLAKLLCERVEDVEADLAELEANGVFSRRKSGCIYSRRMEREEKKRRILRENGKKGGNPSLLKTTEKPPLDNQEDKPTEARSQKPEKKVRKKAVRSARQYTPEFEDFWKAYPDRTNNSKPRAFDQWQALSEDDRAIAAAALPAYRKFLAKPNAPQCVHAERFLSQRRFDSFPASVSLVPQEPVELSDSREDRFLAECRADGATDQALRRVRERFTVEKFGDVTACVTDESHFEPTFRETLRRLGVSVYAESYAAKRRA